MIAQLATDFAGLGHRFSLALGVLPPVWFRPVSMMRVMMNIMQNAVNYGQYGLHLKTWADAEFAYVAVQDRGPGVPQALLPLIQQPFRRGTPTPTTRGGTGLGLAIATRIAREHRGGIALRRRQRGGLEVTVSLRIKPDT